MSTNVHLTPELERFARESVASGRYNNVSEVVQTALRLLQEAETRRAAFTAMLEAVRTEADRDGTSCLDDVIDALDAEIARGGR